MDDFEHEPTPWDTPSWRAKNLAVNRLIPLHFPELAQDYESEIIGTGSEAEGPTIVYSLVFEPFLERALLIEPADTTLLDRIFEFLKMLEDHPDPVYSQVATVEVAEFIADDDELRGRAYAHVGDEMRKTIDYYIDPERRSRD